MTSLGDNVLYLTTKGTFARKEGDTVCVRSADVSRVRIPISSLRAIVAFAGTRVTPELAGALTDRGGHVAYFSHTGRFIGRFEGLGGGSVLLRRAQYRAADDEVRRLELCRSLVVGKLANTRRFLRRAAREEVAGSRSTDVTSAAERLKHLGRRALRGETEDELRGVEGAGARLYFDVFRHLVRRDEAEFQFAGRNRRPPKDAVNCLLSFGYSLLLQDCAGALAAVGLDPAVGFLHRDRPGRLGLALDLMEEFRVSHTDRIVLAVLNRGQLAPRDFSKRAAGEVRLTEAGRRSFLAAYQHSKNTEIRHPLLNQSVPRDQVLIIQARLLARTVRQDLGAYPPFTIQ